MKKLFLISISIIFLTSCYNNDHKKIIITDFTVSRTDTLKPYKIPFLRGYQMYNIVVKGYTNDTIKIKHEGWFDINLSGQIDTVFKSDYYGTHNLAPIFDPYKATKGKITIEYSL